MMSKEEISKLIMTRISNVSRDLRSLEDIHDRLGIDILKSNAYSLLKRDELLLKELLSEVMSIG